MKVKFKDGSFRDFESFAGADLSAADLRWSNLSGADLSAANLRGADLSAADLRGADLSGANLVGADLRCADLSGANLKWADLKWADLRGADLSGADIEYSSWTVCRDSYFGKIDKRIAKKLLYLVLSSMKSIEDEEVKCILRDGKLMDFVKEEIKPAR